MRTLVILLVLEACDSGAPSCKEAVAKAKSHGIDEQLAVVKVCEDKKWSGDLRGCLAKATSQAKADDCLQPVMSEILEAQAEAAARDAAEVDVKARATVEILEQQLASDDKELSAAIDAVVNATSDKERSEAQAMLTAERTKRADLEARIAAARAEAAKAERAKGVHISPECLENPLAKGCS